MGQYYDNFNTKNVNGQSLIHLINLHLGKDIVGAEVGVHRGLTFCTFLQMCPNIKTLHGVDCYLPSQSEPTEDYIMDEKEAEFVKMIAFHNIKYSGFSDKVIFHEKDSVDAANEIEDESLDFVFLDAAVTSDELFRDLYAWYPKVKIGGLIAGHDWNVLAKDHLDKFRFLLQIASPLSTFDNVWIWKKE